MFLLSSEEALPGGGRHLPIQDHLVVAEWVSGVWMCGMRVGVVRVGVES